MRHVVVVRGDAIVRFAERFEPYEVKLQKALLEHPVLLPVDEFDLGGSLLIVGRETNLPSGKPDLLAISEDGGLVIIEMKIGPENSDFRRALAQLIDYGSDLWGMDLADLEERVLRPFLRGIHGPKDHGWPGVQDLREAFTKRWPSDEDETTADDRLARVQADLRAGTFTYVLVAQRLTPSMERSIRYLNEAMTASRFFGVELTAFVEELGGDIAYSARTLVKPDLTTKQPATQKQSRHDLLERFEDEHRPAVETILKEADLLGLKVNLGTTGASLKIPLPDASTPVSIAWIYPPGSPGNKGAKHLTLGYHPTTVSKLTVSEPRLALWSNHLSKLADADADVDAKHVPSGKGTTGVIFEWNRLRSTAPVLEALGLLVNGPEERSSDETSDSQSATTLDRGIAEDVEGSKYGA